MLLSVAAPALFAAVAAAPVVEPIAPADPLVALLGPGVAYTSPLEGLEMQVVAREIAITLIRETRGSAVAMLEVLDFSTLPALAPAPRPDADALARTLADLPPTAPPAIPELAPATTAAR